MKAKRLHFLLIIFTAVLSLYMLKNSSNTAIASLLLSAKGKQTVDDRLATYGEKVKERLLQEFKNTGIKYPPAKIKILAFKQEKSMELWVTDNSNAEYKLLKTYHIQALSGNLGPKLQEGDYQTPEGFYKIESFNPNSKFHLALKLNYPNESDKKNSESLGVTNFGSDIMIHGKDCSVGCLAMGDEPIEEIFVMTALAGMDNVSITISPVDFRKTAMPNLNYKLPDFCKDLYIAIKKDLESFKPAANINIKPQTE